MRYKPGHKEQSRERILKAVGQGFRAAGYGGIGVDGLAREAGVTSGAFYGHFSSKKEAFSAAVADGLNELREGILLCQAEHGEHWVEAFAKFYLGAKRTCALGESCALPSFSAEVERAPADIRETYARALASIVDVVANGLAGKTAQEKTEKAWALLGLLAGGVTLARAVPDEAMGRRIARGVVHAAVDLAKS